MSAQSGDVCESCGRGAYTVYSSDLSEDGKYQIQYLHCTCCKVKPEGNKVVRDASSIRRRNRSTYLRNRLDLKRR